MTLCQDQDQLTFQDHQKKKQILKLIQKNNMKIAYVILAWIVLIIVDMFFAIDKNTFWDSFFFVKDYIPLSIILHKISVSFLSKQDIKMLKVASGIVIIKCLLEVLYITKIVNINITISACIYAACILLILIILGYDRKN